MVNSHRNYHSNAAYERAMSRLAKNGYITPIGVTNLVNQAPSNKSPTGECGDFGKTAKKLFKDPVPAPVYGLYDDVDTHG